MTDINASRISRQIFGSGSGNVRSSIIARAVLKSGTESVTNISSGGVYRQMIGAPAGGVNSGMVARVVLKSSKVKQLRGQLILGIL